MLGKNIAVMKQLYLVFHLMAIINKSTRLDICYVLWKYTININMLYIYMLRKKCPRKTRVTNMI
jgi:hypothetical protein